jgi:hypothetical protein
MIGLEQYGNTSDGMVGLEQYGKISEHKKYFITNFFDIKINN